MSFATIAAVVLAGWLIGATGIGGVLVVPALTQLSGFEPARAIAASGLGFGFPALLALWFLRRQPGLARSCLPLVGGGLVGALGGALLVHRLEPRLLLLGVAALVLFAGVRGLLAARGGPSTAPAPAAPGALAMLALGLLVGVGSALTGTGGPVLLIPLLMLWGQPLALTVAAAQAIQLPVAAAATAVHAFAGQLDWAAGCALGAVLLAGSLAGHHMGRRLSTNRLQTLVSVLLLAIGGWYAWLVLH